MRGTISPLPSTPSWRGSQLKHMDNFTFITFKIRAEHEKEAMLTVVKSPLCYQSRPYRLKYPTFWRQCLPPLSVKVNVNLSLCLTKHHTIKMYWKSVGIAPRILDLDTRWR
jgi:hypothetical protein